MTDDRRLMMGKTKDRLLRIVALAAILPSVHAAELRPVDGEVGHRLGWRNAEVRDTPARPLSKEPRHRSKQAQYLAIRLGNSTNSLIVGLMDESKGTGAGYDTLHIDANGNGDLTDDPRVRLTHEQTGRMTLLNVEPIAIRVPYADGTRRELRVGLEIRGYRKGAAGGITWRAGHHLIQHMQARLDLEGRGKVLVAVYDCGRDKVEGNGCFNDYCADRIRIDVNGDGKLDPRTEDFPLSRCIAFDGKLWDLEIDAAANSLTVEPSSLPRGRITLLPNFESGAGPSDGTVEFVSDERGYAFAHAMATNNMRVLPEGDYRVASARLFMTDVTGKLWEMAFTLARKIRVRHDAEAVVSVGSPFRVEPVIEGDMTPGMGFCLTARITGRDGEEYLNISPVQTRMKPALTITDSDGITVLATKMEYG